MLVTLKEILKIAERFLIAGNRSGLLFPEEPFPGIIARPNCESAGA